MLASRCWLRALDEVPAGVEIVQAPAGFLVTALLGMTPRWVWRRRRASAAERSK